MSNVTQGRMSSGDVETDAYRLMTSYINRLLYRLQQTEKLPIPKDIVLIGSLPDSILHIDDKTLVWQNVMRSLVVGQLVHFELQDDENSRSFWIHMDSDVPIPHELADVFIFPRAHEYWDQVEEWVTAAYKVEAEIDRVIGVLAEFLLVTRHPRYVAEHWPELMPFVVPALHGKAYELVEPYKRPKLPPHIGGRDRKGIVETLAKCSLLPSYKADAWVAYSGAAEGVV